MEIFIMLIPRDWVEVKAGYRPTWQSIGLAQLKIYYAAGKVNKKKTQFPNSQ